MSRPRPNDCKVILVTRRTRLNELVERFNTQQQARFYVERLGADFGDYLAEDRTYRMAIRESVQAIESVARVHQLDRRFLPNFVFGPQDMVVALGQDGLVANTMKYLDGQPLIGVNPDPARWDGQLLPFRTSHLADIVDRVARQDRPMREVSMAEARLNDGQALLAVNDLFIGPSSHISARYVIQQQDRSETHSSSGVIVSTGLGSTGWYRSLVAGRGAEYQPFPWEADYLIYTVREPFPSRTTAVSMLTGTVSNDAPLVLHSLMAERGVIFSDGIESDFLQFNAGAIVTIQLSRRRGQLVV
jgi:NAD kinase